KESVMKFCDVASVFEQIESISSRNEITQTLAQLFKQANSQEAKIITYFSLGSLYPSYQKVQINIAQNTVMQVLARLFDRPIDEVKKEVKQAGDLGLYVMAHAQKRICTVSVQELYDRLCGLGGFVGQGSNEDKIQDLYELLQTVDVITAKYVVRIVTQTLRLGFSDMTIIDALSWMHAGDKTLKDPLEHAYNVCADLGLVAQTLKEQGVEGIDRFVPTVGIPIRPAAAERLPSAQAIIDKLGTCIAQPKLDGFRLQVHMKKDSQGFVQTHFFSRNLIDMSYMFPDIEDEVKKLSIDSLICEGEAIAFDSATGQFLPFQETVKRKRKHDIGQVSQELPLRLFIFDVLYLNGRSLLDVPYVNRRQMLLEMLPESDEKISTIHEQVVRTAKELEYFFLQHISDGLEGVVVKRSDALYQPGKRNFNWIKLKQQEGQSLLKDTVDVVVLGYYYGQGKRASFGIGAFLVGVYNAKIDRFETIAKIGTGLTDAEWKALKEKCDALSVQKIPSSVVIPKELLPDVLVTPQIVCEAMADNITQSPLHTAGKTDSELGYALRFPRFIQYRIDKSVYDATTVTEIVSMFASQYSKKE
ncbi:ATP-dependent DNA ligase, partial [bacterium]|nr:ATP-dependent DNA ligase [bacterium]